MIPFLEGKSYRTAAVDNVYVFGIIQLPFSDISAITEHNPGLELHEHLRHHHRGSWPLKSELHFRSKTGELFFEALTNPYMLIDMVANNIQGGEYSVRFTLPDEGANELKITSFPTYNRVIVNTSIGKIVQNYDRLQKALVENIGCVFESLVGEDLDEVEMITAGFLVHHMMTRSEGFSVGELAELKRIREFSGEDCFKRSTLRYPVNELIGLGVQQYFENPSITSVEQASPKIAMFAYDIAKSRNVPVKELIRGIKQDPFYICNFF